MNNERVTHDRRTNIIHVAMELFLEKGFNHTRIDDIIEKVGIAKGTYYHYFNSKMEVLEAVVEHLIAHYVEQLNVVSEMKIPAKEKIILLWKGFDNLGNTASVFQELMRDEENSLILNRLIRKGMIESLPPHERIIAQGKEEGTLNTPYPMMAAKLLPFLIAATFATGDSEDKKALIHFSHMILETEISSLGASE